VTIIKGGVYPLEIFLERNFKNSAQQIMKPNSLFVCQQEY